MKKNGFTIVELIVAFAITMVVILFLFQIVLSLKGVYVKDNASSQMSLRQNSIAKMINDDLVSNSVLNAEVSYKNTTEACYKIGFLSGYKYLCVYKGSHTENNGTPVEETADVVTYDDYEFLLPFDANVSVKDFSVTFDNSSSILFVNIPITYNGTDDRYDVKIAYYK